MSKLPIDFKIGPVLLEKGTDISVLKQQLEYTIASNEEAKYLSHVESNEEAQYLRQEMLTKAIGALENPIDQLERVIKIQAG